MQTPERQKKKSLKRAPLLALIVLLAALIIAGGLLVFAKQKQSKPYTIEDTPLTSAVIKAAESADILSIQAYLKDENDYSLYNRDGFLFLNDAQTPIDTAMADSIFACFAPLAAQETLTDDITPHIDHLADFGLATPLMHLIITYSNGETLEIKIGDKAPENGHRYMLITGDDHLYLCTTALYDALYFDYRLFSRVGRFNMTPTRIDLVTVEKGDGEKLFEYQLAKGFTYTAELSDETVQNSFFLTYPIVYPADSEWITPILTALQDFVLGPKIAEDTPENRALYGLSEPEYILTVHQARGLENVPDAQGVIVREMAEESTNKIELGGEHNDTLRYLAFEGSIHWFNRYQIAFVYELKPLQTLQNKPLNVPLALLRSLRIDDDFYALSGDEANLQVTKNGEPYNAELFTSRYDTFIKTNVSGLLPTGFEPSEEITRTVTMELVTGEKRVITLTPFDALHNAVGIDGVYLHYLIKGGLTF